MNRTYIHKLVALTLAFFALASSASAQATKPNLVLVSVGVSKFQHRPFERGVVAAAKDALDVARAYKDQEGRFFAKVESRVLVNEQATLANIEHALAWAKNKASADTHVVVFLASHGGPDSRGQYAFVPHDANPLLPSTQLTSSTLRHYLNELPGKCFLILDTCHAGGANRLGGVNFVTLAACSPSETSDEDSDRSKGNGFFTRAFVEGFTGKADLNGDGTVTLSELEGYVTSRLSRLSAGRQRFTLNRPATFEAGQGLSRVDATVALR